MATDFESIRSAKQELVLANLHLAVLFAPITSPVVTNLEDAATGDIISLANYSSAGIIEKGAGVDLGNDNTTTDIEAYGDADPVRSIISKRTVTFKADFLETNLQTLQQFWGTSLSTIVPSAQGGIVIQAPSLPKNIYYRAILLGQDDVDGEDLFMYWIMPKVKLDSVDNQSIKDDGAMSYMMTFKAFKDSTAGFSVAQGFCGPGWNHLASRAGFGTAVTALTATISTTQGGPVFAANLTGTAAALAGTYRNMKVVGQNGINYTVNCSYGSSNTGKAIVDTNGKITIPVGATATSSGPTSGGVASTAAASPVNIVATYTPAGSTTPLTVTQTVQLT
jgi:hypothetical protein